MRVLLLAGALAALLVGQMARGTPVGAPDVRFGVAFALVDGPESVQRQIGRLGIGSWYTYGLAPEADWGPGRAILVRTGRGEPRSGEAEIAAAARAHPGQAWLIGNEPNVPGQDEVEGAVYAADFERHRRAIKGADQGARIVAPNVQNVRASCGGCEGTVLGADFLDAWRRAHRAAHGVEPEIDAFGVHIYNLDWERLPMTDAAAGRRELEAARAYVDSVPAWRGKPIWVTEFGVIWGFRGYEHGADGRLRAVGSRDEAAVTGYLGEMARFMRDESRRLGIERWFVFANAPYQEPFADQPGGSGCSRGRAGTRR